MNDQRHSIWHMIMGISVFFLVFFGCYMIAFALIINLTHLPVFWTVMFTGILGILIFSIGLIFMGLIRMRLYRDKYELVPQHMMTEALAEIAKGNFNILLNPSPVDPHSELVEAINDMAKNLGSIENMRQDFISNISHEIQSPLTSMIGFAKLLQDSKLSDEQRIHYGEIIEAESRRMSAMSENLLKLSALDSGINPLNPHEFRLDKQLQNIILAFEPQWLSKNISIELEASAISIHGDEALLAQVWANLLTNAIKFTPMGGQIEIMASTEKIVFKDSGSGIAKADLIHVFERFYKADKSRARSLGGNGLGLSIVKKIIDLHQGRIQIDSQEGIGTNVTVFLPGLHSV